MHDIFTEMDHRQDILDNHLEEYMSLALSATDTTTATTSQASSGDYRRSVVTSKRPFNL